MKEEDYSVISNDFHTAYRVVYLTRAFIQKKLSAGERVELDAWLEASDENLGTFEDLTDDANVAATFELYEQMREEDTLRRLKNLISFVQPKSKPFPLRSLLSIAAVLFLLLGGGALLYLQSHKQGNPVAVNPLPSRAAVADVLPAGNKATLTLGNGSRIILDSAANGDLATEGTTQVVKEKGTLTYNASAAVAAASVPVLNTLTVPKGGQYRLKLPDGTEVWLNAASSLKYPTAFTGGERLVELTGEGFFKVRHSDSPFKVKIDNAVVEDLGTSFVINTYKDEGVNRATLMEGSIRITQGTVSRTLSPGQQASIGSGKIVVEAGDVEAAGGWMNGKFVYHFTPVSSVLKDLERWYDVEVVNKEAGSKNGNDHHLKATIDRNIPLSRMIRILEGTGDIKLKWDGQKLNVLPGK